MNTIADPIATEPFPAMLESQRCQFISADGRRCAMLRWEPHPTLCLCHARAEALTASQQSPSRPSHLNDDEPAEAFDFTPPSGEFHTATDVNRTLGKIFCLLAQNRIPRRKAVTLGYLGQLLLQTLPQVREEINDCLGYKAWKETLESAFYEDEPEEEPADPKDKNETKLDAKPGDFSAAGSPLETPISGLAETTELAGAGPTCTAPDTDTAAAQPETSHTAALCARPPGSPPEATAADSASSPPEASENCPQTEAAPETLLRGFTYDPWQPPAVYMGPYKSYFDEPEVKEAFQRRYGHPIEEANKRYGRTVSHLK
jgi:hypothetical protein